MKLREPPRPAARRPNYVRLGGGLNETGTINSMDPGEVLGAENYEISADGAAGYRSIAGYERFDGHPSPHLATYWRVSFDGGATAFAEGAELGTSATFDHPNKTGRVLRLYVQSGDWSTGDAAGYMYVTTATGYSDPAWADDDPLYESGAAQAATVNGAAVETELAESPQSTARGFVFFDAGTRTLSAGDQITPHSASPTAVGEITSVVVTSGAFATGDAVGYLYYEVASGFAFPSWADDETIYQVDGTPLSAAVANGASSTRAAVDDETDLTLRGLGQEYRRAAISAVPGSGKIRGVHRWGSDVYAFRDNAGGTACVMHKAIRNRVPGGTGAFENGWEAVPITLRALDFTSGGTHEVLVGDTLTGASSGATLVVTAIYLASGSWAGGDAAGTFFGVTQTGTFAAENLDEGANANVATVAGDSSEWAFSAGGRYEFLIENFGGASNTERMYFVNGLDFAFEFDGTDLKPLPTGMPNDAPNHLESHKNHLFLTFPGGSVQNSSAGAPASWAPVTGAKELGLGDECTGMQSLVGGTLALWTRNHTHILSGTTGTFALDEHSDESGAFAWTTQRTGIGPIYVDDRGIVSLYATDVFGNFRDTTLSAKYSDTITEKKSLTVASLISREKNQYRIFFSDKSALYLTIVDGQYRGAMPVLFEHQVEVTSSVEDGAGNEAMYFGSDDGFVYQLDVGGSFDGEEMLAWMRPAYNHAGSPATVKHWWLMHVEADIDTPGSAITFTPDFSYITGAGEALEKSLALQNPGGLWGVSLWGSFVWSEGTSIRARVKLEGEGSHLGGVFAATQRYEKPHTIKGYVVTYSLRRNER